MKSALSLASIVVGFSLVVRAQAPPPAAPDPPAVVALFLGLSGDQAAQFQQLLLDLQGTAQGLQLQVKTRQQRLQELTSAAAPDTPAIGRTLLEIRALERQFGQALQGFHERFVGLLRPEQRDKLQAVEQAAQLLPAVAAFGALHLVSLPPPAPPQ